MTALDLDAIKARAEAFGVHSSAWPTETTLGRHLCPPDTLSSEVCAAHAGVITLMLAARSDIPALVAEVEALRASNVDVAGKLRICEDDYEGMCERASVILAERDALTARIEAALAVCNEMSPAFWQLYEGGTLDRVRAALSPQEGTEPVSPLAHQEGTL